MEKKQFKKVGVSNIGCFFYFVFSSSKDDRKFVDKERGRMQHGAWVAWTNPLGIRIRAVVDKGGTIASSILVLEQDAKFNMHLNLRMSVLNTQLALIPAVMLIEDKDLMIDAALALRDEKWFKEIMQDKK